MEKKSPRGLNTFRTKDCAIVFQNILVSAKVFICLVFNLKSKQGKFGMKHMKHSIFLLFTLTVEEKHF